MAGRWVIRAGLVAFAMLPVGCACEGDEPAAQTTTTAPADDTAEVVAVVESLTAGSPAGFDPAAWADATDQAAVLPTGATVEVVEDSTVFEGDTATVDVTVAAPGSEPQAHWLFLHKVDGGWLVYGSMPLEVEP
jgi:hypothetical protein